MVIITYPLVILDSLKAIADVAVKFSDAVAPNWYAACRSPTLVTSSEEILTT